MEFVSMVREVPLSMRLACILPTDMAPRTAKMVRSYRLQLSVAQLAPNKFHFDSEYSQAMGYLKAMEDAELIGWDTWKALLDEGVSLLRNWRVPSDQDEGRCDFRARETDRESPPCMTANP